MPDIKSIEAAIELCKDESKLLAVKFGSKTVVPGERIPKAGEDSVSCLTQLPRIHTDFVH